MSQPPATRSFEAALTDYLSRQSLPHRRALLRAIWLARRALDRLPDLALRQTFMRTLRVSASEAKRIEREIIYQDWIVMMDWAAILNRSIAGLRADAATIRIDNADMLRRIARSGEPVMLMPMHMGSYALALARLMHEFFPRRPMLILRAREDRPEETTAMRRISEIGTEMRFLNIADKQSYFDAVKFARQGAVIVCFADLPGSYGGAVPLNLFATPVRLAMGTDALARLAKATVVPLAVRSDAGGDLIVPGRAFQTIEKDAAEKQRFITTVRSHIENAIRSAPEQWHMWARFDDEYRDQERLYEAA